MGITTTIPTNLNFPNRGVLERDDFVNAQETAQDLLAGAYTTALNQYATELNETEYEINLKWEQVQSQSVDGGYSQAYINANFTPKVLNTQTEKITPVDADLIPLSDSVSSFGLKKLSWANIKATLKNYFDTLYTIVSSETTAGIIELATTAEAQAGTDDTRAITPLKLFDSLKGSNQSLSASGYQKIHGGLIIQWGTATSSGTAINNVSITFPISFPNNCLNFYGTAYSNSNSGSFFTNTSKAKTNAIGAVSTYNAGVSGANVAWLAIGY